MDFLQQADVRESDNIREEPQAYIQSQYSASPHILQLLGEFREHILPDVDIQELYDNIVNIDRATGYGLDIWGRIVGISRIIELDTGQRFTLDDDKYRKLIMYKALANISDAAAETLNKMMSILFGDDEDAPIVITPIVEKKLGNMYYNDAPMHVRWFIRQKLSDFELALFQIGGTLCLGAGVGWVLTAVDTRRTFGFYGSGLQPFNQGNFWDGSYIDRG